ncbi:MAG: YggS family pyridoxal phosphate-dependent enzyme [Cyanobacteria bacterium J06649_4]
MPFSSQGMPDYSSEATEAEITKAQAARHAVSKNLPAIQKKVPPLVRLIAVTKTFPSTVVRAAYDEGIRDFAENKVQEALAKQAELEDLTDVIWHFIGHIQSNKARKVVENFDWIHSVDSLKLASRLDRQAAELGKRPKCCLQVKVVPDDTKSGFEVDDLLAKLTDLDALMHIQICGLMVIAPYGRTATENREIFERGQALAKRIAQMGWKRITMDELSMGMSGDFESAIAAGATLIRIGSGLFGQR